MPGPLEGIKVIDFGQAAVGPLAATYLGEMGANVIKVEPLDGDMVRKGNPTMKGMGTTFMGNNITKRGIALNLKDPEDREIALKLAASADVIVDNYRSSDVMIRLGMGYEVISKLNPRIIYLQSSAYGNKGPMKGSISQDWLSQAFGGYTSINGKPGGNQEFVRGTSYMDWNGAMMNAQALLVALYVRERTGKGMYIETSQGQSTVAMSVTRIAEYLATGKAPGPMGSARPNIVPDQAFATSDGYINVSVIHNGFWAKLCRALGRPKLASDPMFATNQLRVENREALIPILEGVFKTKTSARWLKKLRQYNVPCGEYSYGRPLSHILMDHPQVQENELMTSVDTPWGKMNTAAPAWKFSKTPARIPRGAPALDQHRQEILEELSRESALPGR